MRVSGGIMLALVLASCGGKLDGDATGTGSSKGSGAPGDPSTSGSSSGAGSSGATPPARPACALKTPLREDFENGLPRDWSGAPGGLEFDTAQPITGTTSLKIDVARARMYSAMLINQVEPSCAATVKIALRTDSVFPAGQSATIVRLRLTNPASFFDLVLGSGGALTLVESAGGVPSPSDAGAGSPTGPTHPIGTISPNVPTSIVLFVDLSGKTLWSALGTNGGPLAGEASVPLTAASTKIEGVVLGIFLVNSSARSGSYWLDDFAIE